MPDAASPADLRPAQVHIFRAKGARRITHLNASRISEGFDKHATPTAGSIGVLVHDLSQDEDNNGGGDAIVALALIRGIAGVASGLVRATLTPIYRLAGPVPVADLQESPTVLGHVPTDFHSRLLSGRAAHALIERLETYDPGVTGWINSVLGEPREFPADVQQSRVEAKDAVELAAQMAGIDLPADTFATPPSEPEAQKETLLQTVLNAGYEQDLEEELLPLDLQRFDGKLTGKQRAASVSVFVDKNGKDRLMVMSVNKKPIELELGVDLLYWDQVHDSFTFIQYKRLEKSKVTGMLGDYEWAYRRKGEIFKQLALMPVGRQTAKRAVDWRAFGTPFWFKFVRGDAGAKLDNKTLKGMYIPADWLRLAVVEDTFKVGPRGGFRLTYDNAKYVNRGTFTELVLRGVVGTSGERSKTFRQLLKTKKRELIVAIRTEWQEDEQPEGGVASGNDSEPGLPRLPF